MSNERKPVGTKRHFLAVAKTAGVEVSDELWRGGAGIRHIQAESPSGYVFALTLCHSVALHDAFVGERPDWKWMAEQVCDLVPCEDEQCEECGRGIDQGAASHG